MKTSTNKILTPTYLRLSQKASLSAGPVEPVFAAPASTIVHITVAAITILSIAASAVFSLGCSDGCFGGSREPETQTEQNISSKKQTKSPGLDPENPGGSNASKAISQRILFKRGREAGENGNLDEAIKLYRRASEILPGTKIAAQAHAAIGALWGEKGEHQRGLAALSQAMAIDGKNPSILHSLALAYERVGRHKQAWETIQSAQALKDDDLIITADGARLAFTAGNKEKALELLEKFEKTRDILIKKALGGADDKHSSDPGADLQDSALDRASKIQTRTIENKENKDKEKKADRKTKKSSVLETTRIRALEKLAEVPDTVTTRALWPLLDDPSPEIRKNVAWLLGAFGYKESLKPLKKRLEQEKDADVREAIKKAIEAITKNPRSFQADSSSPQIQNDARKRQSMTGNISGPTCSIPISPQLFRLFPQRSLKIPKDLQRSLFGRFLPIDLIQTQNRQKPRESIPPNVSTKSAQKTSVYYMQNIKTHLKTMRLRPLDVLMKRGFSLLLCFYLLVFQ